MYHVNAGDLPGNEVSRTFEGGRHGPCAASFFLVHNHDLVLGREQGAGAEDVAGVTGVVGDDEIGVGTRRAVPDQAQGPVPSPARTRLSAGTAAASSSR
jgi:hypothetical protein